MSGETRGGMKKAKRWSLFSRRESQQTSPIAAFELVYGDVSSAALFRRVNLEGVRFQRVFREEARVQKEVTSQDLTAALSSGMVSPANFLHHLNKEPPKHSTSIGWPDFEEKLDSDVQRDSEGRDNFEVIEALRAVATTTLIYAALPNAAMALSII